jgi:hypothetical protein
MSVNRFQTVVGVKNSAGSDRRRVKARQRFDEAIQIAGETPALQTQAEPLQTSGGNERRIPSAASSGPMHVSGVIYSGWEQRMEKKIFWVTFTVLGLVADVVLPLWWALAATIPIGVFSWWLAYRSGSR